MGNHSSKRKSRRPTCKYEKTDEDFSEDDRNPFDDLEGIQPTSYDKLIAWMIEMVENEDADVSSPSFMEHLATVCARKYQEIPAPELNHRQNSLEVPSAPIRQYSLESNGSSRYSRLSRSREDFGKQKSSLRRAVLSRQSTVDYSDDGDIPGYVTGKSFESDADIISPESFLLNNIEETSFTDSSFRPPLRKNQSCTTYQNCHTSIANLLSTHSKRKSKSLMTMKKMLSETRNDEEITPVTKGKVEKVLDDDMLDRNIADILFSVEALWPKAPMSMKNRKI